MKILITGACGFVGSQLAQTLISGQEGLELVGVDNLSRPGSEINRRQLTKLGVRFVHADIRHASDLDALPAADWVIDAAANPSVLAGVDGKSSPRQLFEHNLFGTFEVLEYCRRTGAGLVLLSSSRVYSIAALAGLPLRVEAEAFVLDDGTRLPAGVSRDGIGPDFTTEAPVSLYGSSKLAGETLALEYGATFDFPVWIDRCGVLAGAGQFGTADQGIFSFWLHAHRAGRPLRYIGFDGKGRQCRDAFHPRDLSALVWLQIHCGRKGGRRLYTAGGGPASARSLAQLTAWCNQRFRANQPVPDPRPRPFDVPWVVMDSGDAEADFGWHTSIELPAILEEIAAHAESHPDWLETSGAL
jgi:CDP-paratose 2-epimerase